MNRGRRPQWACASCTGRSVPKAEQGFGRRVPLALASLLADADQRDAFSALAAAGGRSSLMPGKLAVKGRALPLALGGPPALATSGGAARLTVEHVHQVSAQLQSRSGSVRGDADLHEWYGLLQRFFAEASAAASEVTVRWEYR